MDCIYLYTYQCYNWFQVSSLRLVYIFCNNKEWKMFLTTGFDPELSARLQLLTSLLQSSKWRHKGTCAEFKMVVFTRYAHNMNVFGIDYENYYGFYGYFPYLFLFPILLAIVNIWCVSVRKHPTIFIFSLYNYWLKLIWFS